MISRDELRQLAQLECRKPGEFACTFYFEPGTPTDKSHREEAIRAKDMVRKNLQEIQVSANTSAVVADLDRILRLAESLHGNGARAKAVFACSSRNLWQEFDLPPGTLATRLFVNRRFHIKPLAAMLSDYPKLWIVLVDRQNARFLEMDFDGFREQGSFTDSMPRHGRSDGYAGYDAGHAQRHVEDEVRRHFRTIAEHLKIASDAHKFEALVFGCHQVNCPELQDQLPPELKKRVLGRFTADIGSLSNERAVEEARRIRADALLRHYQAMLEETVNEAHSNGRGVTGLRRVLRSIEQGEVDTLFMSQDYSSRAVECTNCRHLDSHLVPYCPVCGRATRLLEDVCEALVPITVQNNLGFVLLPGNEQLDKIGNIAALLRFRADQNTNSLLAAS